MARVQLDAMGLEFEERGNTIWIHGREGTLLRIKCSGRIVTRRGCQSPVAHSDVLVEGDIEICLPDHEDN